MDTAGAILTKLPTSGNFVSGPGIYWDTPCGGLTIQRLALVLTGT